MNQINKMDISMTQKNMSRLIIVALCLFQTTFLQAKPSSSVGETVYVEGIAKQTTSGKEKPLQVKDNIFLQDTLETEAGKLKVLFKDKTVLSLEENSKVLITELLYNPKSGERKSIFDILQGRVRSVVEKIAATQLNSVEYHTATAVAGIRGTEVGLIVEGKKTTILCFDGLVEAYAKAHPGKKTLLKAGEYLIVSGDTMFPKKKISDSLKKKFSYRYLKYPPLTPTKTSKDRIVELKQDGKGEGNTRSSGQTNGDLPNFPALLPGGSTETPIDIDTAQGTPAGDPTPITPIIPATPDPVPPLTQPETVPPPAPSNIPVNVPVLFPNAG